MDMEVDMGDPLVKEESIPRLRRDTEVVAEGIFDRDTGLDMDFIGVTDLMLAGVDMVISLSCRMKVPLRLLLSSCCCC